MLLTYSGGFGAAWTTPAPDTATAEALMELGYALAGCTRGEGWSVSDGLCGQPALVRLIRERVAEPAIILAWGSSMGGQIVAGLAEDAEECFDGALSLCGSVAGAVGMLNQGLDGAFAALTLLADRECRACFEPNDDSKWHLLGRRLTRDALESPEGRARLSLACALAQVPEWTQPGTERPAVDTAILEQQAAVFPATCFSPRADMLRRAGGQFSWNDGIDYGLQLRRSGRERSVREHYARAGVDLDADLETLRDAPRVRASSAAVRTMHRQLTPSGELAIPLVTLNLIGDYAPVVSQVAAYSARVDDAGRSGLLRSLYLDGPGHCAETVDERVSAVEFLVERVRSGTWPEEPAGGTTRFVRYVPSPFLRTEAMPPGPRSLSLGPRREGPRATRQRRSGERWGAKGTALGGMPPSTSSGDVKEKA